MSDGESAHSAPVEALLQEVLVLSNQIKKAAFQTSADELLPTPTKVLLQDLRRLGPRTVPDLARERASSRQNVQIIVNRLEKLGYVTSGSNPNHKKSELISITEQGELLLEKGERETLQMIDRLSGVITERQADDVLRTLKKVRRALGDSETNVTARRPSRQTTEMRKPVEPIPSPDPRHSSNPSLRTFYKRTTTACRTIYSSSLALLATSPYTIYIPRDV